MNDSMEKTIKKLKNRSIIAQVVLFILSLCGSAIIIGILVMALASLIINSRFSSSFLLTDDAITKIEGAKETGADYGRIVADIQDSEKRPLAISVMDKDGKSLAYYGEKVDLDNSEIIEVEKKDTVQINVVVNKNIVGETEINEIPIDIQELMHQFFFSEKNIDEASEMETTLEKEVYKRYFWVKTSSDDIDIYIKNELVVYGKDCLELIGIAAVIAIIFVLTCIGRLVRTISNIISQRYYIKLLLSDPVTGGNNEFAFTHNSFKTITSFLSKRTGFAIIDMSLVKYKNYCTLYGIDDGEKLLKAIYKSLRGSLNRGELISHVTNGDFFILLKTGKDENDEKSLAARARYILECLPSKLADIETKVHLEGVENIQTKAGLYYLPPVTDEDSKKRRDKKELNVKSLCIKAGIAKNALVEDNGFKVYNHDMWEKEVWERKVEDMMQAALDNEEFQVYIQPKYDPSTEELKGGEALVRWISPTEGFINPGQFIPIFERTGFVTKLDDYMIAHTAKLQSDWLEAGKKIVPISVNVSRAHFAQPDLAEHIRDIVDQYPLPHNYIEIELTESAFFDDKNALLTTVHKLQEYGFEVSMDDFGSGYSSLNSLKDLPLNVLKLDAEFFRGDDFGGRGEIVVSEAIALAKQLDMRIVAEGVEKKEQVDFLATKNCDMIQGYYFAKPMPANEYESRMS